ncbi:MAG: AAA family ATPase [Deltaproteobacteria bacterium]|nr:MAG: AAA family ATPase [Pseudomonadota bacterium]PIE66198.1 MAG: AAA family ATPase [Deltaproteobacteria bacterium]
MSDAHAAGAEQLVSAFQQDVKKLADEIGKVIVGNEMIIEAVLTCLLTGGHGLIEGVPGLGKTMLVRTLAECVDLNFSRIQFTPDLMPADIVGTMMIVEDEAGKKHFEFQRGPVFANILLADEINRATPKTQSAMLEAMQEQRVTISRTTHQLEQPFMVLATQNPLEMEGTYPLPEAQLDRFLYKIKVEFPDRDELHEILDRTTKGKMPSAEPVMKQGRLIEMRDVLRQVPVSRVVQDYAIRMLQATHPDRQDAPAGVKQYVRFGSSPRGAQALLLGAKMSALLDGRYSCSTQDIRKVAPSALRHRVILNFEGEAEGVTTDQVVDEILETLPKEAA